MAIISITKVNQALADALAGRSETVATVKDFEKWLQENWHTLYAAHCVSRYELWDDTDCMDYEPIDASISVSGFFYTNNRYNDYIWLRGMVDSVAWSLQSVLRVGKIQCTVVTVNCQDYNVMEVIFAVEKKDWPMLAVMSALHK